MSVKSKFSFLAKFGLIIIPLITIALPFMIFLLPPEGAVPNTIKQYIAVGIVYSIFAGLMLLLMTNFKQIIVKKKKIGFKWVFSRKIKYIPFKYLDGYKESKATNTYGQSYDVLYLIKNGKKVAWICEVYYSNYYDIQENLLLEYLGSEKPGIFKQFWDHIEMVRYRRKYLKKSQLAEFNNKKR